MKIVKIRTPILTRFSLYNSLRQGESLMRRGDYATLGA